MTGKRHLLLSVGFSIVLTILVIGLAGYYETPGLLIGQFLFIAGPTLVPFVIANLGSVRGNIAWVLLASILSVGWSYVIYIDTRPYQGGGASFALLAGWFTCFVAIALALIMISIPKLRH